MVETDSSFQLLTNEEVVESLDKRNENKTDSDEDGEEATKQRKAALETVLSGPKQKMRAYSENRGLI